MFGRLLSRRYAVHVACHGFDRDLSSLGKLHYYCIPSSSSCSTMTESRYFLAHHAVVALESGVLRRMSCSVC